MIKAIVTLLLFRLVIHPLVYAIISNSFKDEDDEIEIIDEDALLDAIGHYLYLRVFPVLMIIIYIILIIRNN